MADLERWSADANQNDLVPPDGAPENWVGENVNDTLREAMAAVRRVWESDGLRNILVLPNNTKLAVLRDGDRQFSVVGADLTTSFPVGQRVFVGNVTTQKWASVLSATFTGGNTVVVVQPEGDDQGDGPALGTGSVTVVGNTGVVTDDGLGTDPTPFSAFKVGDLLSISQPTLNEGFWQVTAVASGNQITLATPFNLTADTVNEGPVALTIHRIDINGTLPASITDVYLQGTQTEDYLQEVNFQKPATLARQFYLGAAAFRQPRQLVIGELHDGAKDFVADDASRLVRVEEGATPRKFKLGAKIEDPTSAADQGSSLVVDPTDYTNGFVLSSVVLGSFHAARVKNATQNDWPGGDNDEKIITGLEFELPVGQAFDGTQYVLLRFAVRITPSGTVANSFFRIRVGPNADGLTNPVPSYGLLLDDVTIGQTVVKFEQYIQPAAGDRKISLTFRKADSSAAAVDGANLFNFAAPVFDPVEVADLDTTYGHLFVKGPIEATAAP